jgi:hypothetical protein
MNSTAFATLEWQRLEHQSYLERVRMSRIDRGEQCYYCTRLIDPPVKPTKVLGVPLLRCPHCGGEWVSVPEAA